MDRVGLVAPLPPQVGGVASVAEWLLAHENEIGVVFDTFDLRPSRGKSLALLSQPGQFARFTRWSRKAPRLVHVCVAATRTGLARDAALIAVLRLSGRRVIAHVHGPDLQPGERASYPRAALFRLLGRLSEECVAISQGSAATLASSGAHTTWIPNPVRFPPEHVPARAESQSLRLLLVGTYSAQKGSLDLLEALARARAEGVDARLTLVGPEKRRADRELLKDRTRALGLENAVEIAGSVQREDLSAYYEVADVIALPSRAEGLPMALLEGMSFGLPVLATRVGGIPDIVEDGCSGFLVEPGDIDALTRRIIGLSDPALRRRLGAKARERVSTFADTTTIVARWRELYVGRLGTAA